MELVEQIYFRAGAGTKARITQAARKAGVTVSEWLRDRTASGLEDSGGTEMLATRRASRTLDFLGEPKSATEAQTMLAKIAGAVATGELDRHVGRDVTSTLKAYLAGSPSLHHEKAFEDAITTLVVHADLPADTLREMCEVFWSGLREGRPFPEPGDRSKCPCGQCRRLRAPEPEELVTESNRSGGSARADLAIATFDCLDGSLG